MSLEPARELRGLGDLWRSLESKANASFFLSWSWIGTWLAELPQSIEPLCLTARKGNKIVALGLFTPRRALRRGVIASRQLHLHATGDPQYDCLTIEHNGLLCRAGEEQYLLRECLLFLLQSGRLWDEISLNGVAETLVAGLGNPAFRLRRRDRKAAPFVDLASLSEGDYLSRLGANTRQQIRRSRRIYGEIKHEIATTKEGAGQIWRTLEKLHQETWQKRSKPGAFARDFFRAFHGRLIAERLGQGEIQLLKVMGESGTVGCLYNFVYRARVHAYQSGLAYGDDNRLKPGLVAHHEAIELNRRTGQRVYDFLAGGDRYKRGLATDETALLWPLVQRPKAVFKVEDVLRSLKERMVSRLAEGGES